MKSSLPILFTSCVAFRAISFRFSFANAKLNLTTWRITHMRILSCERDLTRTASKNGRAASGLSIPRGLGTFDPVLLSYGYENSTPDLVNFADQQRAFAGCFTHSNRAVTELQERSLHKTRAVFPSRKIGRKIYQCLTPSKVSLPAYVASP